MAEISMKDYVDQRFLAQEQRVALALQSVEKAYQHSQGRMSYGLAVGALLLSLLNLALLIVWHNK